MREGRPIIERVKVNNWQSLRALDIELGRLTVIVGSSNSGKSALIRALQAVTSNVRGSDFITRGTNRAAVTVHTGGHIVTLERSVTGGLYRIVDLPTGREDVYTKLGGGVPEHVTAALNITPVPTSGSSINFAGQFDVPYLCDTTGSVIARVLGELTNVTVILGAVREANRRRNGYTATLRTRQADLADYQARAAQFATLPARLRACDAAEQLAAQATALDQRIGALRTALGTLRAAEDVLARTVVPEVPDAAAVLTAQRRLTRFRELVTAVGTAVRDHKRASTEVAAASTLEAELDTQLHATLVAAGTCPTCRRAF